MTKTTNFLFSNTHNIRLFLQKKPSPSVHNPSQNHYFPPEKNPISLAFHPACALPSRKRKIEQFTVTMSCQPNPVRPSPAGEENWHPYLHLSRRCTLKKSQQPASYHLPQNRLRLGDASCPHVSGRT